MKIQILLFFVGLFCACEISQNAQVNDTTSKANSNFITNANAVKQTENAKPKLADDSRFKVIKIKRTDKNKKFKLKIDVEYPQLKTPKSPQEIKLNQYVKKQVSEQILDFTKFLADREKNVKSKAKGDYEINLTCKIDYFSDVFTSILMEWNGYSGYLNYDYFPSTINFDLKNGKAIKLKNIFEPNSKYLEKLSELSIEKLRRTCLSCPCKNGVNAGDSLPEGEVSKDKGGPFSLTEAVSAKEENFYNWSITTEGLKITFNEYQVGPGCIGIIHIVIPFNNLRSILKKDLNFK